MPEIGQTISHYRIIDKLGQGGMGVVYRAEDTNLNRQVAIKVLPDAFSGDPERMARFEREAKLLASLNHPNIAAIHGLEHAEGKRFLVMELVEGETLAERIAHSALPVDEALEVCRQLAAGLEAAHEKDIIHRDLKPANVKITPEGKIKVLDFGLAKASRDEPSAPDASQSPTLTGNMTRPGVILGTSAYMSPEQAKGKAAHKQSDIWAFGCILFECLTGKRAFEGETATENLAAVIRGEPAWEALPAATPGQVRDLLRRCLQKNPNERQRDIGDVRIEITEAANATSIPTVAPVGRPARGWMLAALVGGPFLAAAAALITWQLRQAPSPAVVRSVVKIESGLWLGEAERPERTAMAVSSDGQFIIYSAIPENMAGPARPQIYLRRMDQMNATPVPGTEGGISAFLSPDDRWIGFWVGRKLKKVPVGGGVPTILCDAASPLGADWGRDNAIVFSSAANLGLFRISSEGGKPEVLTVPDKAKGEFGHRLPHFLPDGRGVVFTVRALNYDQQPRLALLDLETRKWHEVMGDAADGRCLRSGHLVFLRQGILMAGAFDMDLLQVKGQPVPVVGNTMQALSDAGQYSVSNSGWLAHVPGGLPPDSKDSLARVDQKGDVQPIADLKGTFLGPRFSIDGRTIAYQTAGRAQRAWTYDLARGITNRLTEDGQVGFIVWTPDGRRLVSGWCKSGPENLYWQAADGSSPMERLTTSDNWQSPGSFTPDGSTLAFVELDSKTNWDILLLDMKSRRVTPFLNSPAVEGAPEISPDGRWLAYASNESGNKEVWVRPFPGPGSKWRISNQGGGEPIWGKDGRQLFYRRADQVWVADVRTEGGFSAGRPRLLFEQRGFGAGLYIRSWDLWPDGRGFLMVKLEERKPEPATEIVLVQNWLEELKRLVPVK